MKIKFLWVLVLSLCSTLVFAAASEEEEEDYESIVSRLSAKQRPNESSSKYNLDDVMFHVGLGYSHSAFSLADSRVDQTVDQPGFNLMLGVDLLSPQWLAEVNYINYYGSTEGNLKTAVQEFDLKILYHNSLTNRWGFRVGGGLAARYLHLEKVGEFNNNYTTPASVLATAIEAKISPSISIISEISMKNALVSDTPEKRSLDFMIRVDGHL